VKINITIDVSREVLEGIFITSIEGGSNYWCEFSDEALEIVNKTNPKDGVTPFSQRLFNAVFDNGAVVPIHDAEGDDGDEPIGELCYDSMLEGLRRCANEALWALQEERDERGDASSSDVVFQYMALGEFVYG
jgi:hypothetical protein